MRLIVVSVTTPSAPLRGYLRRFLLEPTPCLFVGGVSRDVMEDVCHALIAGDVPGFMLVAAQREELGYQFRYFHVPHRTLADFDGITLIESDSS